MVNFVKLSEIAEILPGKIIASSNSQNGKSISYVRITDMENYSINTKNTKKIKTDQKTLDKIPKKFILKSGDVLLSTQATIGKTAIVTSKTSGNFFSSAILALRTNSEIKSEYLHCVLNSKKIQEQLQKSAKGTVILRIQNQIIRDLKIPIVSAKKQQETITKFKNLTKAIESNTKTLEKSKKELSNFQIIN
tara:strand:+ start:657 stop:1232 length:576 start_codon:yes stop_codon:yes gene_type:complete